MRKRFAHMIKKNEKTEKPTHVIFFDTETYEIPRDEETELRLKLGQLCYWRVDRNIEVWESFEDVTEFWDIVEDISFKTNRKVYLVAHNAAFDFRVLKGFEQMNKRGYETKKMIYNGTTNIWEFRKEFSTICVLDNMNFFKSSLKSLGDSVGLKKLDMPTDDAKKLREYCKRDVEIMLASWRMLMGFLEDNDLGNFQKTIASQAFAAYRHRFMDHPIYVHTNQTAINLERESYHGGRTECFFIGKAPKAKYFLLDVNSMYPSVMRDYEYPTKLVEITGNLSMRSLRQYMKIYCVTARVDIKTNDPVFASKIHDKLIFATGQYETVLTTREIEYAIKHNLILKVKRACLYEKAPLFKNYVEFFYNKRAQYKANNQEAFSYMCKLFLNSLYGKFGQRNEHFSSVGFDPNMEDGIFKYHDVDEDRDVTRRVVNGKIEKSDGLIEGFNSFVAIAAHITADARMKLWEYFEVAGRNNIFYSDTDSMIVNMRGYQRSKKRIGDEMGMLSLKDHSDILRIHGAKDYQFGNDVVIKGIRKDAKRLSDNSFEQVRFEGIAGALRKDRLNKMFIGKITKTLSRKYDKGIVEKSGRVSPIHNRTQRLF